MKSEVLAVAAALAGVASAGTHAHRHEALHFERGLLLNGTGGAGTCGVTTVYSVITGTPQLYFPPAPTYAVNTTSTSSIEAISTSSSPLIATTSSSPIATIATSTEAVVPTPYATTCPTPGTYTIPATTITITEDTTVCAPASTTLASSGTYSAGGVVTVVDVETTVVCPYATTSSIDTTVTSVIETTTYVCPSAGTYTIAPLTTSASSSTVWVYPVETSYPAGTYTQPEVVVTVTETDYVVYCPFATSTSAVVSSAAVVYVSTSSAASVVASTTSAVAVSTAASSTIATPTSTGGEGSLGSSGDQWAMCYTPYNPSTGDCLSAADVLVDITLIKSKGFTTIRMYSSSEDDCSGLANVGAAVKALGMTIVAGIWIGSSGISGASEQVTDLLSWGNEGNWDLVEGVLTGNEAIASSYCTASELATFITSVKSQLTSAGFTGGVSTTEPLDAWQASTSELCDVVDWVGVNLHAFFNADCEPEDAGAFVLSELTIADGLCSGKTAWNMETGWPSYSSSCNGVACGTAADQATAIASIKNTVGARVSIFSYSNDLWKAPGDFGCEQSWGCIDLF